MKEEIAFPEACYIDPVPASAIDFTRDALKEANGGEAITVIIVTCSEPFGVASVVVIAEAIVSVAS
jgi:hypothetical protein